VCPRRAGCSIKQATLQMVLEGRDGTCDGCRRAVQLSPGLGETFMLGDGDEDREGFWTDHVTIALYEIFKLKLSNFIALCNVYPRRSHPGVTSNQSKDEFDPSSRRQQFYSCPCSRRALRQSGSRGVASHQGGRRLSVAFHGLLSTCGHLLHGQNAGLGGRVLLITLTKKADNRRH